MGIGRYRVRQRSNKLFTKEQLGLRDEQLKEAERIFKKTYGAEPYQEDGYKTQQFRNFFDKKKNEIGQSIRAGEMVGNPNVKEHPLYEAWEKLGNPDPATAKDMENGVEELGGLSKWIKQNFRKPGLTIANQEFDQKLLDFLRKIRV